jgi:hypothetical protein
LNGGGLTADGIAAIAACALVLLAVGGAYTKIKMDVIKLQVETRGLMLKVLSINQEQAWQVRSLYRIMYRIGVKPPDGFDGHQFEGNGEEP